MIGAETESQNEPTTQNSDNRKCYSCSHKWTETEREFSGYFFCIAFKSDKKPPKRKKQKKLAEADESLANDNEDEEGLNVMPAPPPSKRQKKKQKQVQNLVRNKDKEIEKTISYLTKWETSRDEWKYEKLRQIFIQKNIFDDNVIPNEHSEIAIKYLATSKVTS